MSRRTLVASIAAVMIGVLAIVAGLVAVLRDGGGDAGPVSRPPSATPEERPAVAPLTGLPAGTDLDHPAVAIKVSDVRHAHPQVGVDHADIVFAEPIGVSYTRLAAVSHSTMPELVGPVRSVRPADAPLLGPLAAVFGNTMGAGWVMDYVDSVADLDDLGTLRAGDSDAYVIDSDRPAPDHVFARPAALLELSDRTAPPSPYFAYAAGGAPSSAEAGGGPGSAIEISYGPTWQVAWTYDAASGTYLRDEPWGSHVMAGGTGISAVNVLVLDVTATVGKIGTGSGAPVPILDLVDASGRFQAFAGGASVTGTWSKGDVNEPFQFRTDAGDELLLEPGNTWVELPPAFRG
ncbi:DUF3048 domain-containing protein [Jiangella rhizosphaerae]|uniref:DUF3048 domain-containing protein n=1 Tax=Jiangella rhizosphaerae TaxID=2293569 RepID=A0A418KL46_9ACTN|nr:DUF3048 domain-containing protein [Jiangella rhizosphaerae]RIQ18249.1 DUF3048 domain-containing protein [Jiangella rhizosphaerae]